MSSSQVHALAAFCASACWGVTAVVWVMGALYNVARGARTETGRQLVTSLSTGIVAAVLVLGFSRVFPSSDWHSLTVRGVWLRVLGSAILVCSTVFTLWARLSLGTMWSGSPTVKVQHQLRTEGPYGVTRHPIYTGLLGMLLGTALAAGLGAWVVALPAALLLVEIRIHAEEGLMLATFPEVYPRYRRQVPQLVPGLRGLHRSGSANTSTIRRRDASANDPE